MDFQRTPISVLQDQCTRLGVDVEYQLLSVEGYVHAPTFAYRVKVGDDIIASATGQSKKKAKHAAALIALQMLTERTAIAAEKDELVASISQFVDKVQQEKVEEDVKVTSNDNPVGKLQELCMRKRWPPPQYDKCQESGLPHERMFTMICELENQNLSVFGHGRSKKIAKRMAAQEMLRLLEAKNLYDPNVNIQSTKNARDNLTPLTDFLRTSVELCKDLLDKFWLEVDLDSDALEHITQKELSFYDQLNEVADRIDCNIQVVDLTNENTDNRKDFSCVIIHLFTNDKSLVPIPVLSSFGKNETIDAAKEDASRRALAYVKKMKIACCTL